MEMDYTCLQTDEPFALLSPDKNILILKPSHRPLRIVIYNEQTKIGIPDTQEQPPDSRQRLTVSNIQSAGKEMGMLVLKNRLIMAVLVVAHVVSIGLKLLKYAFIRLYIRLDGQA